MLAIHLRRHDWDRPCNKGLQDKTHKTSLGFEDPQYLRPAHHTSNTMIVPSKIWSYCQLFMVTIMATSAMIGLKARARWLCLSLVWWVFTNTFSNTQTQEWLCLTALESWSAEQMGFVSVEVGVVSILKQKGIDESHLQAFSHEKIALWTNDRRLQLMPNKLSRFFANIYWRAFTNIDWRTRTKYNSKVRLTNQCFEPPRTERLGRERVG